MAVDFNNKRFLNPDFLRAVALGQVSNASYVSKHGENTDVGTSYETIWTAGGVYAWIAAATVLKVSSGNVNDTSAGSGAQTVKVEGLDTDYLEISETVTLNGRTAVNTALSYLRVHRMTVQTGGANGENAGILYAGTGNLTTGVPDNIFSCIAAGENRTLQAFYTIPAGVTGYLVSATYMSSVSKRVTVRLEMREIGGVFVPKDNGVFIDGRMDHELNFPEPILEKTDIQGQAKTGAGSGDIACRFEILLIDN